MLEGCLYLDFLSFQCGLGLHVWQGEEGPPGCQAQVTAPCHLPGADPAFRKLGEMGRGVTSQEQGRGGRRSTCPFFPLPRHWPLFACCDIESSLNPGRGNAGLFGASVPQEKD